jgi:hypothetical protein
MPPDYSKMMKKAKTLPTIEVDEAEFVRLMIESGKTEKEAKFQAKMSKGLGSAVMVGDKMVKIK